MFHNSAIIKDTIKIRRNAKYRVNGISRDLYIAVIDQLRGETTSIAKFNSMDVEERTENQNEWKNVQNTVRDGRWRYFSCIQEAIWEFGGCKNDGQYYSRDCIED